MRHFFKSRTAGPNIKETILAHCRWKSSLCQR